MKRFMNIITVMIVVFACCFSNIQAFVYMITNGTNYPVQITAARYSAGTDDNFSKDSRFYLQPGGYVVFESGGVLKCIQSMDVSFFQKDKLNAAGNKMSRGYAARHPVTGLLLSPNIAIRQIPTDRYDSFKRSLDLMRNSIGEVMTSAGGLGDINDPLVATAAGLGVIGGAALAPELVAIVAAAQITASLIKEGMNIYASSLCRDRQLYLTEVPKLASDNTVQFETYPVYQRDANGNVVREIMQYPATEFEFITKD